MESNSAEHSADKSRNPSKSDSTDFLGKPLASKISTNPDPQSRDDLYESTFEEAAAKDALRAGSKQISKAPTGEERSWDKATD